MKNYLHTITVLSDGLNKYTDTVCAHRCQQCNNQTADDGSTNSDVWRLWHRAEENAQCSIVK